MGSECDATIQNYYRNGIKVYLYDTVTTSVDGDASRSAGTGGGMSHQCKITTLRLSARSDTVSRIR
jgi:hypothetical protein